MKRLSLLSMAFLALSILGTPASKQPAIQTLLDRTDAYCRGLTEASFHFACLERVRHKGREDGNHTFVYDYRLIKESNIIREKRMLTKMDGKAVTELKESLNRRFSADYYSFAAALAPIYFLGREYAPHFRYSLTGKRRLLGRSAWEITVFRRPDSPVPTPLRTQREGNRVSLVPDEKEFRVVTAWLDHKDFSVLGFQAYPAGIAGYNELVTAAFRKGLSVEVKDIHLFGLLREGIRYPTKREITLVYSPLNGSGAPAARKVVHLPGGSSGLGAAAGGRSRDLKRKDSAIFTYTQHRFLPEDGSKTDVE